MSMVLALRNPSAARSVLEATTIAGRVATEESDQMVVYTRLNLVVSTCLSLPFPHRRATRDVLYRAMGLPRLRLRRNHVPAQQSPLRCRGYAKLVLDLPQKAVIQEGTDLGRPHVHDAVQAEIQVAPVKLEHLSKQPLQLFEAHCRTRRGSRLLQFV